VSYQLEQAGRSPWAALLLIAVGTLVAHLAFGVHYATHAENLQSKPTLQMTNEEYLKSFPGWEQPGENDAAAYNRAALGVLHTGIPRNRSGGVSAHALVYDYFLAACYWVGGVRLLAVAIPQAVLSGLTSLLVGLIAFRLASRWARAASCLAALMVLINLRFAIYVGNMMPTVLLLFLFAGAMCAAVSGLRTPGALACFVGALVLAAFTQAAFFIVAVAAAAWMGIEFIRDRRPVLLLGAAVLLGFVGVRIALSRLDLGGDPTDGWRATDRGGILWEDNNPYYESMRWTSLWERRPGNPWTRWRMSEAEQQRYTAYLERAGREEPQAACLWIRDNPRQYAKLCWIRLRTELGPYTGQMSPRNRLISTFYWFLIFPAGWYGWWRLRRLAISRLALLVIVAILSFDMLVFVEWYLRYRLPVDLILTAYAGVAYSGWLRQLDTSSTVSCR
jgi:hypothetical protein